MNFETLKRRVETCKIYLYDNVWSTLVERWIDDFDDDNLLELLDFLCEHGKFCKESHYADLLLSQAKLGIVDLTHSKFWNSIFPSLPEAHFNSLTEADLPALINATESRNILSLVKPLVNCGFTRKSMEIFEKPILKAVSEKYISLQFIPSDWLLLMPDTVLVELIKSGYPDQGVVYQIIPLLKDSSLNRLLTHKDRCVRYFAGLLMGSVGQDPELDRIISEKISAIGGLSTSTQSPSMNRQVWRVLNQYTKLKSFSQNKKRDIKRPYGSSTYQINNFNYKLNVNHSSDQYIPSISPTRDLKFSYKYYTC